MNNNNNNYNDFSQNEYNQQNYNHQHSPYEYPNLFLRWLALFLDNIVYSVISGIVLFPTLILFGIFAEDSPGLSFVVLILGFLLYFVAVGLYYCIMTSKMQGTLGKKICGLKVVHNETGQSLTFFQAFVRFFVHNLLGIFTLIGLLFNSQLRLIHDLAAKSIVLKK